MVPATPRRRIGAPCSRPCAALIDASRRESRRRGVARPGPALRANGTRAHADGPGAARGRSQGEPDPARRHPCRAPGVVARLPRSPASRGRSSGSGLGRAAAPRRARGTEGPHRRPSVRRGTQDEGRPVASASAPGPSDRRPSSGGPRGGGTGRRPGGRFRPKPLLPRAASSRRPPSPPPADADPAVRSQHAIDLALAWLATHQSRNGNWGAEGFPYWCDGKLLETSHPRRQGEGTARRRRDGARASSRSSAPGSRASPTRRTARSSRAACATSGRSRTTKAASGRGCPATSSTATRSRRSRSSRRTAPHPRPARSRRRRRPSTSSRSRGTRRAPGATASSRATTTRRSRAGCSWRSTARGASTPPPPRSSPLLSRSTPRALDASRAWIEAMTDPATGRLGYVERGSGLGASGQARRHVPGREGGDVDGDRRVRADRARRGPARDPFHRPGNELIAALPPVWDPQDGSIDMYYWHFGAIAMAQVGGEAARDVAAGSRRGPRRPPAHGRRAHAAPAAPGIRSTLGAPKAAASTRRRCPCWPCRRPSPTRGRPGRAGSGGGGSGEGGAHATAPAGVPRSGARIPGYAFLAWPRLLPRPGALRDPPAPRDGGCGRGDRARGRPRGRRQRRGRRRASHHARVVPETRGPDAHRRRAPRRGRHGPHRGLAAQGRRARAGRRDAHVARAGAARRAAATPPPALSVGAPHPPLPRRGRSRPGIAARAARRWRTGTFGDELVGALRRSPWFVLSAAVHGLALFLLMVFGPSPQRPVVTLLPYGIVTATSEATDPIESGGPEDRAPGELEPEEVSAPEFDPGPPVLDEKDPQEMPSPGADLRETTHGARGGRAAGPDRRGAAARAGDQPDADDRARPQADAPTSRPRLLPPRPPPRSPWPPTTSSTTTRARPSSARAARSRGCAASSAEAARSGARCAACGPRTSSSCPGSTTTSRPCSRSSASRTRSRARTSSSRDPDLSAHKLVFWNCGGDVDPAELPGPARRDDRSGSSGAAATSSRRTGRSARCS